MYVFALKQVTNDLIRLFLNRIIWNEWGKKFSPFPSKIVYIMWSIMTVNKKMPVNVTFLHWHVILWK